MPIMHASSPRGQTRLAEEAPPARFQRVQLCRAVNDGANSSGDNGGAAPGSHPPGMASTSGHAHASSTGAGASSNGLPASSAEHSGAAGAHSNRGHGPHPEHPPPHIPAHHPHPHGSTSAAAHNGGGGGGSGATGGQDGGAGGSMDAAASRGLVHAGSRSSFKNVLNGSYTGEGLFVLGGSLIGAALCYWTVGTPLRRFNPYSFHLALPTASGVVTGTPLRMKGVPMGSVLSVTPRLDHVEVEVEVNEVKTIIPRNAKFELTQSGMIPAAAIDISIPEGVSADVLAAMVAARQQQQQAAAAAATASATAATAGSGGSSSGSSEAAVGAKEGSGREGSGKKAKRGAGAGAKAGKLASPKDVAACHLQGVLVCNGDKLDGLQGGSMDELMAHMLKQLRQGEPETATGGTVPGRGPVQG
ncbi:hypothetical protein HYH02_001041 [Chlamydomonas schloesseri]|uniref:Mce/MlaD domain-containing protein n=1 Tax=Chlamydomonas schloesseri TaxID=2026947 RepID=A0A836BC89_9CHLO|nr:hypothetical protein HYH02_001041 [Chlamydomonas schloesseri]|eukprot:KAG2453998.1 hypothetical protein HYH02_001041 [Chlamydomonas schloesseri]